MLFSLKKVLRFAVVYSLEIDEYLGLHECFFYSGIVYFMDLVGNVYNRNDQEKPRCLTKYLSVFSGFLFWMADDDGK